MRYPTGLAFLVLLLGSFMAEGCFLCIDQGPPPVPTAVAYNITWADDGKTFSLGFDTSYLSTHEYVRTYMSDGSFLAQYSLPTNAVFRLNFIPQDSSVFAQDGFNYSEYNYITGARTLVGINGNVLAQSPDHHHFLVQANSYFQSGSNPVQLLQLVEVRSGILRVQKEWFENMPYDARGIWINASTFGYYRVNADTVLDFLILDTTLHRLDSILPPYGPYPVNRSLPPSIAYAPQSFYFYGAVNLTKMDSATRDTMSIGGARAFLLDASPDGSFIIAASDWSVGEVDVVNARTRASKSLGNYLGVNASWKISPQSDKVAFVTGSGESLSVSVLPVSAP